MTDWVYYKMPLDLTAGEQGYQDWLAGSIAGGVAGGGSATPDANGNYVGNGGSIDYWASGTYGSEVWGRNVFFVWNLDDVSDGTVDVDDPAKLLPEKGTVFKFITNKTNQLDDVFTIAAPKVEATNVADDVKKISVYPNPYMGYHDLEGTDSVLPLPKYVTFNHLPTSGEVTFRVFNMAGTMVANFMKKTTTQYQQWDMRNSDNFPLASGVYIIHIDMGSNGTKVLKLAMVTEDEFAKRF